MNYVIKRFDETTGQLTIEFDPTMGACAIDVPLTQDGLYITGEELDTYIKGFAPIDFINRKKKVAAGIANSAVLKALETEPLVEAPVSTPSPEQIQAVENAKAAEVEKFVKAALIKYNIIT